MVLFPRYSIYLIKLFQKLKEEKMKTEQTKTTKSIQMPLTPTDKVLKTTATAILLIAGTWLILKISKEMLKELEGMGL